MTGPLFGRNYYLELLNRRVSGLKDGYRQNLALLGDELVGKTSIISSFLNNFRDSRFLTMYLEARQENADSFCRRFIASLLYNFLLPGSMELREDLDFLIAKCSAPLPRTVEKVNLLLADLKKKKRESVFTALLSLTDQLHDESGIFCVVFIDEFHNLDRLEFKKLYKEWAQLLMVQKSTMYVIASSAGVKARAILSKELSLLFGNFEVIQVDPFDLRTSEDYLESRLKAVNIEPGVKKFVTDLTGGNPHYLSVIADMLSRDPAPNIAQVIERLLFDTGGCLHQRFLGMVKSCEEAAGGQDCVSILARISAGCNKTKDIAHLMRKLKREIDPRVNSLIESDMVRRSGDFLIISDRLFAFWLRFVYRQKLNSLGHDLSVRRASFRATIEAMLLEFAFHSSTPVPQRMAELLRLFADERIQVERKSLRLDRFREIKPLEFGAGRLKDGLICRSNDSVWILAFSNGGLTEDDISDFSRECKKYRNKMMKKIIVNLAELDYNSRLKALEEKIITWDLDRVNQILDLYSRPRIIA